MSKQTNSVMLDRKDVNHPEFVLQLVPLQKRLLVLCTGDGGETFHLIEEPELTKILESSIDIHKTIDSLIANKSNVSQEQRGELDKLMGDLGRALYEHLFQDDVQDVFNMTLGRALVRSQDVVIRIMTTSDFLNIVPWELLCDKDTYLCLRHDIVRHPFVHQPVRQAISSNEKLRVLFVGANPCNDIHVAEQIEAIGEATSNSNWSLQKLISPTAQDTDSSGNTHVPAANYTSIANEIYDGVDILHFLAHGKHESRGGASSWYFMIDRDDGEPGHDKLPVEMLESFCRANPMRLAILNSCRSDQAVNYNEESTDALRDSRYYSMARALIRTGVSCVVGMSHPISKLGAKIFSRRIYRSLIDRDEPIGRAVRLARLELFAYNDVLLPSDWMTPILYARDVSSDKSIHSTGRR